LELFILASALHLLAVFKANLSINGTLLQPCKDSPSHLPQLPVQLIFSIFCTTTAAFCCQWAIMTASFQCKLQPGGGCLKQGREGAKPGGKAGEGATEGGEGGRAEGK